MNSNPVCWFEIYVQDLDRAKSFYEKVLKTELTELQMPGMEMLTFPMDMGASGAAGALVKMDGFPSGGSGTLVYFSCDDCSTEASRVDAAGGKIEKSKFSIGEHGFIALGVDTEGNMFGLHSQK
ncbi:MAG: VOC family protein [Rubripirellula sp.]